MAKTPGFFGKAKEFCVHSFNAGCTGAKVIDDGMYYAGGAVVNLAKQAYLLSDQSLLESMDELGQQITTLQNDINADPSRKAAFDFVTDLLSRK